MSRQEISPLLDELASQSRAAYERVKPEIDRLRDREVLVVNVHVPSMLSKVLPNLSVIRGMRPCMIRELPKIDHARIDALEDYALALSHTHVVYRDCTIPKVNWTEEHVFARALRDRLLAEARVAAQRGLLPEDAFAVVDGHVRFQGVATDLEALDVAYRTHWSDLVGKTPILAADLERARTMSAYMLDVLRKRDEAPVRLAEATRERARAFTIFLRAYDLARRVASHLRWDEGDADVLVPWIHPSKHGARLWKDTKVHASCLPKGELEPTSEAQRSNP